MPVPKINCSPAFFAAVGGDGALQFVVTFRNLNQCEPRATLKANTKRAGLRWSGKYAADCVCFVGHW